MPETDPRPLRADARRNRDAILAAALVTFESDGAYASLDGIALRAGVGNATLYRNFPTRDDLLAAAIGTSVDTALAEADDFTRSMPPRDALAEWMKRMTWQLRVWQGLPSCVATARDEPTSPLAAVWQPLHDRTAALVAAAQADGSVRAEVTAEEVVELATALAWGVDRFGDDEPTARRRVAMATAGIFRAG